MRAPPLWRWRKERSKLRNSVVAEISPLDTALFAFRKREHRFVLTRLAIAYVVLSLIIGAVALAANWPALSGLADWYLDTLRAVSNGEEPAMPPSASIATLLPLSLAFGVLAWILLASFEAACLRWLVRNERGGGVFGLKFDADTWRVFAIYWIWIGLALTWFVAIVVLYFGLRTLSGLHPVAQFVVMLVAALAPLGLFALLLWGAVRLSPAAALTVARKQFSFYQAWVATRGRFWPLLGAFVIVCVAYFLVSTVMSQIIRIPMTVAMAPIMRDILSGAGAASIFEQVKATLLTPAYIALFAGYAVAARVLAMVFYVAWFGVNARAVLAITEAATGAELAR